jgi:hypothetical protein
MAGGAIATVTDSLTLYFFVIPSTNFSASDKLLGFIFQLPITNDFRFIRANGSTLQNGYLLHLAPVFKGVATAWTGSEKKA